MPTMTASLRYSDTGADYDELYTAANRRARAFFGEQSSYAIDISAEPISFAADGAPTSYRADVTVFL